MRELTAAKVERLQKVVRMLSSDNEHIRSVAALTLNTELKNLGLDIHDFAAAVAKGFVKPSPPPQPPPPRDPWPNGPDVDEDWRGAVEWCACQGDSRYGLLRPKEQDFIETLEGWRGAHPTDKQMAWLRDIVARLSRRRRG